MRQIGVVMLIVAMACTKTDAPVSPSTTTGPAPAATTGPRITMPNGVVYSIEVVADDEQRAQGLMFRDHLRPNTGMLFAFPEDGEYAFWMKNTLIPLDMIWLDAGHKIVHIKRDVPPCKIDDCPSYPPGVPSRYVLELAGGDASKLGLKVGDALRIDGVDGLEPR
jgi:uncharacterized protein